MLVAIAVVVVLLVLAAGGALVLLRARSRRAEPDLGSFAPETDLLVVPGVVPASWDAELELDQIFSVPDTVLYLPTEDPHAFLALARPEVAVPGRTSNVPTQLTAVAVSGQAAVEGLVKAGQVTGRLVLVDAPTAEAIKAGTIARDAAGEMLGVVRGAKGQFGTVTRLKAVPGSLVRGAVAGPAIVSSIATQMQMARIEKAIGEVRDAVSAVQSHLDEAERASVLGRREVLRKVYRTAQESSAMTQALWDQIQHLEDLLVRDAELADRHLEKVTRDVELADPRLVGNRRRALEGAGPEVAAAVARVADARRAVVQFSMLRLWWLAVSDDATLVSQQRQLIELLDGLPDHQVERDRVEAAFGHIADAKTHQRVLAPRKHKELPTANEDAVLRLSELPWKVLDVAPRHDRMR